MSAQLLAGRPVAQVIRRETAAAAKMFQAQLRRPPALVSLRIGDDPASAAYGRSLDRACGRANLGFHEMVLPTERPRLTETLQALNIDPGVDGVIVQQPLPAPFSPEMVGEVLEPQKDVDGLTPVNAGRVALGQGGNAPSTPAGGMALLYHYGIPLEGAEAVLVGRSAVVGRPMASLLLQEHATVTICHTRTRDLAAVTLRADILCVAAGRPNLITPEMVSPGAVVVDFGTNVANGGLVGDVDPAVSDVAAWLTPVPGGTGPVTTAILLRTTVQAACARLGVTLTALPTNGSVTS
ncbi:MAG: bifunctional 5,10-methylene-tetrahydrofolate dehydrogenase/5,10-methylene-tetrahydrofolate cyclohydrolase [Dehalococcoidia bacterium]|nr:bifunctional 5,10-methylene-tetrahydrofolate dehydrogenase/5,10-methylene-tetrahydrofolate cyclohydrolase [Dehalococcoidia bacterium]